MGISHVSSDTSELIYFVSNHLSIKMVLIQTTMKIFED
jgi:hypothetical protein